jgi:hypothetical protein
MRMMLAILAAVVVLTDMSFAQVVQLYGTNELAPNRTTISFDDYPHATVANALYQNFGVTFSRDDGFVIPIMDITRYGWQTTSGNNVLYSGFYPIVGPTNGGTTHTIVNSLQPLTEIGAFFGNDQYIPEFAFQRLSIYGASHEFLGLVDLAVNNNGHVDQFIGLRSSVPFYYARFENFDAMGNVSPGYGIAIDDLTFTAVTITPKLRIERLAAGQVRLAWPAEATGFAVQTLTNIASTNWQDLLTTPVITGSEKQAKPMRTPHPARHARNGPLYFPNSSTLHGVSRSGFAARTFFTSSAETVPAFAP